MAGALAFKGSSALRHGPHPDAAILDIRLGKEEVYLFARDLTTLGVRLVFATGGAESAIPEEYAEVNIFRKPLDLLNAAAAIFPYAG